jgi:hypothetical protein
MTRSGHEGSQLVRAAPNNAPTHSITSSVRSKTDSAIASSSIGCNRMEWRLILDRLRVRGEFCYVVSRPEDIDLK